MKQLTLALALLSIVLFSSCVQNSNQTTKVDDLSALSEARKNDLRFSIYITAHAVERMLSTEAGRREAVSLMRCNGITKVYLEVYRGGLVVKPELLDLNTKFFQKNGFDVVGGIATVPGKDFGVRQEGPLGWFNWQNEKTQKDLKKVIEDIAPIFDTFIVDDFLCTGDTSMESKTAKGNKSWGEYRRDLLVELSEEIFIKPAKAINPDITMVIKYPQWYDRFHMFGYDVVREPKMYDKVWVGTESRGQYTQRFGFVQPYEGFISYRWMNTLAGEKMGGAWFDHGDCDDLDFIEQAWQSVLAGAKEIVIFEYHSLMYGHKGHHHLRNQFEQLADLAKAVAENPVEGVVGYKPPHSDPGGDLYVMDYIGMFGTPLVPDSKYPENAKVVLLPTQAAHDADILAKAKSSLEKGATLIVTAGFLAEAKDGEELAALAGVKWPVKISPIDADYVIADGKKEKLIHPLNIESDMKVADGEVLLEAIIGKKKIPFFSKNSKGNIFVMNTHTFSQADFDAVGEVLLCPRQLGLLEVPQSWANTIRTAFNSNLNIELDAPTRVTMQTLKDGDAVIHNYNKTAVELSLTAKESVKYFDILTGKDIPSENGKLKIKMAPRSRVWVSKN
jgi:hypothetical protein